NKNPTVNSVQRDYMAGEVSKDLTRRFLLPEDIVRAHEEGLIHFHDSDYFAQRMHNCCLVNLEDMLQNGTVISETMIEKPHSFATACNIATQAIAQIASSQYGGQSITLSHLVPFVEVSRQKFRKEVAQEFADAGMEATEEQINTIAELRVRKEINRGVQVIQYQVITLMTTNGQAPFITVFMYLDEVPEGRLRDDLAMVIEEMLKQRIQGVKNEKGVWITPAFPKLIYVLDEDNVSEDSKYYYLTKLAAKCTAKRMVPDYISAKKMKEFKNGDVYPCMGCRSFLTPDTTGLTEDGSHKYYGRFNQGVVTLNLVDVACSSGKDEDLFWKLMDERTELCKRALMCRHERLLGTPSDVAPILWQYGALARLKKGEKIDKLLYNNYSTISLGYAGLCECTKYMKGVSHTDEAGKDFALRVMQYMNDKCAKWRAETNISFSLYGTPLESTTYKFAKCLQKRFGSIPGVTDRNYITNSYHVHVTEEIDAFTKLKFESEFQALSPGGAISYVEVPNMMHNIDAVLGVMEYIYDNIMYAELNTKSDYCQKCGYDGEIQIVSDHDGKLVWQCPVCGNRDQSTMNVARRTCGYIGTQFWNQGRTQEIKERVLHL
ncbi:MAG TPA: anaerobic ribonucleoside-triphosphate reductase, partial [Lachnospiraceae bacterium]|nr:anaerobic ribonucleoside-triphosphate reductase [Lachnospiraceae bacterium]